jgi:hypothetical protein
MCVVDLYAFGLKHVSPRGGGHFAIYAQDVRRNVGMSVSVYCCPILTKFGVTGQLFSKIPRYLISLKSVRSHVLDLLPEKKNERQTWEN